MMPIPPGPRAAVLRRFEDAGLHEKITPGARIAGAVKAAFYPTFVAAGGGQVPHGSLFWHFTRYLDTAVPRGRDPDSVR